MVNAQLDRVGEFFDYFEQARVLKTQAGEHQEQLSELYRNGGYWVAGAPLDELKTVERAIISRLKLQSDAGVGANSLQVIRTDEEVELLEDSLSDHAREITETRNGLYARLNGLKAEATEKYAGTLVVVKALGDATGPHAIQRVVHEGQSSGEYKVVDHAKGSVADIDIASFGLSFGKGQLTVEKQGRLGGLKRFRVDAVQAVPRLWSGYAPKELKRNIDIEFLDK